MVVVMGIGPGLGQDYSCSQGQDYNYVRVRVVDYVRVRVGDSVRLNIRVTNNVHHLV